MRSTILRRCRRCCGLMARIYQDGKKDFDELATKNSVLSILEWIMGFVDPLWGPDEDLLKNEEAKTGAANSHEKSGVNLEGRENVKEAPSAVV